MTGFDSPSEIEKQLASNPDSVLKLRRALNDYALKSYAQETERMSIVNATMRAEYASTDKYNARWRATFGYAMAISWFVVFIAVTFAIVYSTLQPEKVAELDLYGGLAKLLEATAPLWSVAMVVLGVNVHKRSKDKELAVTGESSGGILSSIKNLVRGK